MKHPYRDIHEATGDREPLWYDENGVPRYCEFTPGDVPNIYADQAVLYVIQCAGCGQLFTVAVSCDSAISRYDFLAPLAEAAREGRDLAEAISYGDAPYHDYPGGHGAPAGGQCAGTTMISDTVRVLEVWRRGSGREWERWEPEAAREKVAECSTSTEPT